ncbi:MAG: peptidase M28, partial [Pseudomonadota bacterium]
PLDSVIAAFNFDTVALAPAGAPVGFVGEGRTPLDTIVLEEMLAEGRDLGDRAYAERFVQRQDAWALLQKGVPAVLLSSAFASQITSGPFFGGAYHSPDDEVGAIELGGAIDDLLLHEALVKRLAIPSAHEEPARP